jgi:DNA-binding CsgD family transcriptional regulator
VPHVHSESREEQAHLAAAAGDPGRAEDLHQAVLRLRSEQLPTFVPDSLDALAGLAATGERWAVAARLLAASDAGRERVGYPRRTLDRPGHEALVAAVRSALGDEAFTEAWTAGRQLSLDEAAAYASRSRGPRQRPTHGWDSLTPTERQVVALVAEGLTNPQIAERLFVSRATVKTHLSHVYTKLDVTTRAQLAGLASRRAPTPDPSPPASS